jgi:hypothetical protein
MPEQRTPENWDAGGWPAAEANTRREGARLSLYEKLLWLEEIEEVFLNLQRSRRDQANRALFPESPVLNEPPPDPDVR